MVTSDSGQREPTIDVHETFGVRLFAPSPRGFDPLGASDRELLVYGFPARPDERELPELHDRWRRMVSRSKALITPRFAPMPSRSKPANPPVSGVDAEVSGTGWSGAVAFPPAGDAVTFVSGQWTVPDVVATGDGLHAAATWVGIDGYPDIPGTTSGSTDILQAGTTQDITAWDGGVAARETFAWYQWYPGDSSRISNMAVSPGDVMGCTICVYSPTEAGIFLLNTTTGLGCSFIKDAPAEWLLGDCAEWVLEVPYADGVRCRLPRYGEVFFDNCIAGTRGRKFIYPGIGDLVTMYDSQSNKVSTPQAETDYLFKVQYTA